MPILQRLENRGFPSKLRVHVACIRPIHQVGRLEQLRLARAILTDNHIQPRAKLQTGIRKCSEVFLKYPFPLANQPCLPRWPLVR